MRGGTDAAELVVEGWQPIETAPKGELVLIHSPDAADWYSVCIAHFVPSQFPGDEDAWYSQEEDITQPIDAWPTHWMPLPDVPEATS